MQLVKYRVQLIQSTGEITQPLGYVCVTFLDSVSKKQATATVAQREQRAPENVILTELSRESV